MAIFNSDGDKIDELNKKLCEKAGFPGIYSVSTQTVRYMLLPCRQEKPAEAFLASAFLFDFGIMFSFAIFVGERANITHQYTRKVDL